jgi:hypothetical protein
MLFAQQNGQSDCSFAENAREKSVRFFDFHLWITLDCCLRALDVEKTERNVRRWFNSK